MPMPEPVRYQNKGTYSGPGMLRFHTEVSDAGMPMPAASALMPIPSFFQIATAITWLVGDKFLIVCCCPFYLQVSLKFCVVLVAVLGQKASGQCNYPFNG
jgi:hypothetical protein